MGRSVCSYITCLTTGLSPRCTMTDRSKAVVAKLQRRFNNSDQQDAQDFLAFFLDGLHEDLNENALKSKLRELTPDEERRRERMPLADVSNIEWGRYKHNHNSFLVELFQGQLVSILICSVCGQTSTTCNAFMNLSIEISLPHDPQGLKLMQCIDAFVKEEVLEGENAWYILLSKNVPLSGLGIVLIANDLNVQQNN
jgi:ubiquitin carboxyl-terminal hydrolase 8